MDKNKAIQLQLQVKENADDLNKEFMDMQAWEEQMKKKDFEIRNSKSDKVLPPVRTKKKILEIATPKDHETNKPHRIKGSDYESWEKFDVEKACDALEDNLKKDKGKLEFEIPSEEELEKEHEKANKFKEEGNALVKKKEYASAIGKYSQAIKTFPHDATFYANRALCQLELNNLYSAESDCTDAIKLNSQYVKAYYRRATARVEMKRYEDAKKDLEVMLELEPSNKEAKTMLAQVLKKIEKLPKPLIISGNETDDKKTSLAKKIGEKLFSKKSDDKKPTENLSEVEKTNTKEVGSSYTDSAIEIDVKMNPKISLYEEEMKKISKSKPKRDLEKNLFPSWLPKLKDGVNFVETSIESSSKKKQKLRRISIIEEIPKNESIFKEIQLIEEIQVEKPTELKNISNSNTIFNSKNEVRKIIEETKTTKQDVESIPPPPKSSVSFLLTWRKNASLDFRYKYLKQILPQNIPDIFKESMEFDIFSNILKILNTKFIPNEDKVFDFVYHLSKLKRFRALVLFMDSADKEATKNIFEYCKTKEGKTDEELTHLYSAYEM